MGYAGTVRTFATLLAGCAFFMLPAFASAATTTQTAQVLPPGGTSCAPIAVLGVQPYIYDGHLDSYDVTISDPSYVALDGKVGDAVTPLHYMTRFAAGSGVRIHVDLPSTQLAGTVPVTLTLMSAAQGQPVCLSTVTFTVSGPTKPTPATPSTPAAPATPSAPSAPQKPTAPAAPSAPTSTHSASSSTSTDVSAAGTFVAAAPILKGVLDGTMAQSCSADGSFEVWFVLLALYVALVAYIVLGEPAFLTRDQRYLAGSIIAPLIVLVCFWYFVVNCRAADWIPLVILAIGMIGLLIAFREANDPAVQVISLPAGKDHKKEQGNQKKGK